MTPEEIKQAEKSATKEVLIWVAGAVIVIVLLYVLQVYILGGQFLGNLIIETPKLYCLAIWLTFTMFSSRFEALYFAEKNNSKLPYIMNEHSLFVCIRACIIIPLWILTSWKVVLCYAVMFPFFHDGNYYRWRNKIESDVYPKRWFSESVSSTAFSTKFMTPVVRTILAVVSLGLLFSNLV